MAKSTWTFRLDERLHVVKLEHGYFSGKRNIHVDGKLLWVFVSSCLLIPLVSLGGALPGAIGAGGAAGFYAIARDSKKQIRTRIVLCLAVTILCWVLFIVTLLMIKRAAS